MSPNINDLRMYNKCPLLFEQRGFYQENVGQSSLILGKLQGVFNNVFYQTMRGRNVSDRRIANYWREAIATLPKPSIPLSEKDLQFPAQCLTIFMDIYGHYTREEITGPGVPFEVPISPHTILEDFYPLLTKTNFGTRITLFDFRPNILSEMSYVNDFFLSIYSHAFRREFGRPEFCITVCNLGDGKSIDIVKDEATLRSHMEILAQIGEHVYSGSNIPALSECSRCPIYNPCSIRRYGTHH